MFSFFIHLPILERDLKNIVYGYFFPQATKLLPDTEVKSVTY